MGATLAKAAYGPQWVHLPWKAHALLVFMALTALDNDKPPRYYGGRDALVCCFYPQVELDPKRRAPIPRGPARA